LRGDWEATIPDRIGSFRANRVATPAMHRNSPYAVRSRICMSPAYVWMHTCLIPRLGADQPRSDGLASSERAKPSGRMPDEPQGAPAHCGPRYSCKPISKSIRPTYFVDSSAAGPSRGIFAEVRCHLGVETQRQCSDPAIARKTSTLLGRFSLLTLWAQKLYASEPTTPRAAA
jgi:hypothetical protein